MRTEITKIRSLPTPAWCLAIVVTCFLLGIAATVAWGPGEDSSAIDVAVGIPTLIASIVFGVWMFGVEFGQSTLRRTLTADPRRGRLIAIKLLVTLLCVAGVTALLYAAAVPLYDLASSGHDQSIEAGTVARYGASALVSNLVYATVGFAFALITTSMAGGITLTLVFIFVIDTVTSIIPKVGDFAMGPALSAITDNISGYDSDLFGEAISSVGPGDVAIILGWLVGLMLLGCLRFMRSEVK
jgi:ABC-2 type transport system permease protein